MRDRELKTQTCLGCVLALPLVHTGLAVPSIPMCEMGGSEEGRAPLGWLCKWTEHAKVLDMSWVKQNNKTAPSQGLPQSPPALMAWVVTAWEGAP